MDENDWLAQRFEEHRSHLRSVAYRMLGSVSDADDAVQDAWLRLSRTDPAGIDNLAGWLTTVVARVCLDMLRARASRRATSLDSPSPHRAHGLDSAFVPDPIVEIAPGTYGTDPEHEALQADSVGGALLVVLETLEPAERLAFVLHDVFAVPFEEIAPIVGRTPSAARQLASRARRRVQGASAEPDVDLTRQREVVDAFLAASRSGDFDALLAVLDPDVVFRLDRGAAPATGVSRGAQALAGLKTMFWDPGWSVHPALVNGSAGLVVAYRGRPLSVMAFTVAGRKIVEINVLADPARIRRLGLPNLPGPVS
jgi:RNA polymerase sigma factor (sigma-70 family)